MVQEKAIRFPIVARLYDRARQRIVDAAQKCTCSLKTFLGRVIRDVQRKYPNPEQHIDSLVVTATKIFQQQRKDKVYSVHAPEVECISKRKAHKQFEFGCKVSVLSTKKGG